MKVIRETYQLGRAGSGKADLTEVEEVREGRKNPDFPAGASRAPLTTSVRDARGKMTHRAQPTGKMEVPKWGRGEGYAEASSAAAREAALRAGAQRGRGERSQRGGGSGWRRRRAGAECPVCTCGEATVRARRREALRPLPGRRAVLHSRGLRHPLSSLPEARRPACGVEWPEPRAPRAEVDDDGGGVDIGGNNGLSRRGR